MIKQWIGINILTSNVSWVFKYRLVSGSTKFPDVFIV